MGMATAGEAQLFGDYAALLRAALPDLGGWCCQARAGEALFAAPPPGQPLPATPPAAGRQAAGPWVVDTLVLDGHRVTAGTLSLWLPAGAAPPAAAVAAAVEPVRRVLARELGLRLELLESRRRLGVQAAEERLLHAVEQLVHRAEEGAALLATILSLCRRELPAAGAALLVPGLGIRLQQGEAPGLDTVGDLFADLATANDAAEPPPVHRAPGLHAVGLRRGGGTLAGVFVLAGLDASAFSERRLARIARYVVSHVESLLDRDYDRLTGLADWSVLARQLGAAAGEPDPCRHTLLYFDVDQMHVVNEAFGAATGDELLAAFGGILRASLPGRPVARLDGDHFVALLRDTGPAEARALATAIAARLPEIEFRAGEQVHRPSVSIGVGALPASATSAQACLAPAQVACQAAKERGRGRVEVYAAADQSIIRRLDDIQLVGYVRSAIDRGRLTLVAQPIVATRPPARRPYYEVLVRLLDDTGRLVSPAEFLSAAERYQLMEELDRWVVTEALRLAASVPAGIEPPRLAINLSGHSLGSERFPAFIQERIEQSGVPPDLLCFEITESVAVANMQRAQQLMHGLRRLGCHLSLDDFGTGLSSFAYLKLFPIDTLKIDGSFIRDVARNAVSQSMVAAIAEVARVMQLETVAEFVEDEPTLALVGRLGITWAQGYHLGEPRPLAGVLAGLPAAAALTKQRSPGLRPAM
jgi:diguanylate cyclase (GGDEF)-like protein